MQSLDILILEAENRSKFRTIGFNDISAEHESAENCRVLTLSISFTTLTVVGEPLARRMRQ
jgi:hypothetical protein